MTVKELKKYLELVNDETEVILSSIETGSSGYPYIRLLSLEHTELNETKIHLHGRIL